MSIEKLNAELASIPTPELVRKGRKWISDLCASGGQKWSLRVPPDPEHDPDLIFGEMARRLDTPSLQATRYLLRYTDGDAFTVEFNGPTLTWYVALNKYLAMHRRTGEFHVNAPLFAPDYAFDTAEEAAEYFCQHYPDPAPIHKND